MQFKDAAFEILKIAKQPLHYNEITDQALASGLLDTTGKTPHATMGALLYTDTLNPDSRFRRGDQKGTFTLKSSVPTGIKQQIDAIRTKVRQQIKTHLSQMAPQKFEELIRALLEQMGFVETVTTPYSGDQGVDVRGELVGDRLSTVKVAIQAKRWKAHVGAGVVRDLRGSINMTTGEQGIVITPSDFTAAARAEAKAPGKIPISLVNGEQLVDLLIHYQVGVKHAQYTVPEIDEDYWTEMIGLTISTNPPLITQSISAPSSTMTQTIIQDIFPLSVQREFQGVMYTAELLDQDGKMQFNGVLYQTPTAAAKAVPTGWKEVNGWDFWRYQDPVTGVWKKIGSLRLK